MKRAVLTLMFVLGVRAFGVPNPAGVDLVPTANEAPRAAPNPASVAAGPKTGLSSVTVCDEVIYDRQGNEIAEGTVDAVSVDSLYWKNSSSTANLYYSAKTTSPSPTICTAMSFQNDQTTVCMDQKGDYVYEVYGSNLRRLSTADGSATNYALPHNGNGSCGNDGQYIYVPRSGSSSSIDKYTLTGTYVNTTTINIAPHDYGFAVARDTVWATNNTNGIVTYYGYARSRFTGGTISEDTLWRVGDVGASTPMNIAWDGQYYYFVSGGYSSNPFFRFRADRTLYTSGTFAGNARGVMCRGPYQKAVMIMAADGGGDVWALRNYVLDSCAGAFDGVDAMTVNSTATFDPTNLYKMGFRAILTWSNAMYYDPAALGDSLARFIQLGGGVADAVFSDYGSYAIQGRYRTGYSPFTVQNNSYASASLGTVHRPLHPIMAGVATLSASNYVTGNTHSTLRGASYCVAEWNAANRVVAACFDSAGQRAASLGLFPGNALANVGNWVRLIVNALRWVTHSTIEPDVGGTRILAPTGGVDSGTAIVPACSVYNCGNTTPASYNVRMKIGAYNRTVTIAGHAPGTWAYATFPIWVASQLGSIAVTCSTELTGDISPFGDCDTGRVEVHALPRLTGWVRRVDLPSGFRYKPVKDGGALCVGSEPGNDTGFVYAFKGNSTCEFYRYNIIANAWIARESIPAVNRLGKKKAVKKGSSLVFGTNGKVYATKGNGTLDLWEYDPATRVWTQKADVPPGAKTCKEGVGTVAVCEAGTNCVYLLKGSGTYDFYRYDADADIWDASLVPAPAGPASKPYKSGSCLVYDSGDTIYALKGSYNEFYAYALSGARWDWTARDPLPLIGASGAKKKVKDGAGMAYFKGAVYALKGGNTNEFWLFNCIDHKWYEQPQLTAGAKKVKSGGALTFSAANKTLYAFRGNNTREFWQYWIPLGADRGQPAVPDRADDAQARAALPNVRLGLRVAPTPSTAAATVTYSLARPGNVSLRLHDITGRVVAILASGYHPAGEYSSQFSVFGAQLSAGVYLLDYEADECRTTEKLVIE